MKEVRMKPFIWFILNVVFLKKIQAFEENRFWAIFMLQNLEMCNKLELPSQEKHFPEQDNYFRTISCQHWNYKFEQQSTYICLTIAQCF